MTDAKNREMERAAVTGDLEALEALIVSQRRRGEKKPIFSVQQLMLPKPEQWCLDDCNSCAKGYSWSHDVPFDTSRLGVLEEFTSDEVEVVFDLRERDYQGNIWTLLKIDLAGGIYAIYRDGFGSCSGCDGFIDASPEERYDYVKSTLAEGNCRTFFSLSDICDYLLETEDWSWSPKHQISTWSQDFYAFMKRVWELAERDDLPEVETFTERSDT